MLQRGMTHPANIAIHLSDLALIEEVKDAAARERGATARLVALLAELDARRLYLGEGCSSLFTYCTQVLRLSEHAAYGRIEAARIARKFPVVLDLLAEGAVTLTTLTLLGPLLTPANHQQVLAEARHQSKREVEQLVARLRPLPPVAESVRKLPTPKTASGMDLLADATSEVQRAAAPVASPSSAPPRQVVLTPLAPDRYKVQLTVTRATHDKLRRAQDLLRHSIPTGDLAEIVDRAVTLLLADLERAKLAAVERPRAARSNVSGSRYIPRPSGEQCGDVTAAGARSSAPRAAARNGAFSSFTTFGPTPLAVRRLSRTSNCAAARTISTRPSTTSAVDCRCSGKREPEYRLFTVIHLLERLRRSKAAAQRRMSHGRAPALPRQLGPDRVEDHLSHVAPNVFGFVSWPRG